MNIKRYLFYCFIALCCPLSLAAQSADAPKAILDNPYNTVYVHLYYLQADSYRANLAATTIQAATPIESERLAIQLKQILDGKGLYVRLNTLPQDANYIDSTTQKSYYTLFPKALPEIYLEKVGDKWYYSKETSRLIPELHQALYPFGMDALLNILPKMGQNKLLGLAIWQYIGLAILLCLLILLHFILSRILRPIISKISHASNRYAEGDDQLIRKVARSASLIVLMACFKIFLPVLQLPPRLSAYFMLATGVFIAVLWIVFLLRILALVYLYAVKFTQKTTSRMDEQALPIIQRMVQMIVVLGGLIQILGLLDVNVTALIAGISIGGLALALAAQDTVKNLIGSLMIFIDRPFQIGDYIEWGSYAGTVVEVGFRTTRIQISDSSIISVPNGTIANVAVVNKGVRVFRLFNTILGITYGASPELIKEFTKGLTAIIIAHPMTAKENYYVHLSELADSSLNILFRVPILVDSYAKELQTKEDLLLEILKLAEQLGIDFAFPSSSVYVEGLSDMLNVKK